MANSVDPDETPHSAASHQGLYCLLRPVRIHTVYTAVHIVPKPIFYHIYPKYSNTLTYHTCAKFLENPIFPDASAGIKNFILLPTDAPGRLLDE